MTRAQRRTKAPPTWEKTFGFRPLAVFANHGAVGSGEPLAIAPQPGNAESHTAGILDSHKAGILGAYLAASGSTPRFRELRAAADA